MEAPGEDVEELRRRFRETNDELRRKLEAAREEIVTLRRTLKKEEIGLADGSSSCGMRTPSSVDERLDAMRDRKRSSPDHDGDDTLVNPPSSPLSPFFDSNRRDPVQRRTGGAARDSGTGPTDHDEEYGRDGSVREDKSQRSIQFSEIVEASKRQRELERGTQFRSKKSKRKGCAATKSSQVPGQSRYWTAEEHDRFLEALQIYNHKDLKAISNYVATRNQTQVRTHTQKYFMKLMREAKRMNDSTTSVPSGTEEADSGGDRTGSRNQSSTQGGEGLDRPRVRAGVVAEDVRSVPEECGVSLLSLVAQQYR